MNNNSKRIIYIFTACLLLIILIFLNKLRQNRDSKLIILSFCSLAPKELPVLNDKINEKEFPNITSFLNKSVIFTNSYGSSSWSNTSYYIFTKEWKETFKTKEEQNSAILNWKAKNVNIVVYRIPGEKDLIHGYSENFSNSRLELPLNNSKSIYDSTLKYLNSPGNQMVFLHFKLMHYPFLSSDLLSDNGILARYYSPAQLSLINEYRNNPSKYPDKFSFFQYLFGDEKFKNLFVDKNGKYIAYLTTPGEVLKWKNSLNYNTDLEILKIAYHIRLTLLDRVLGEFVNYYNKHDNTAIAFIGDHGETFGNREYLSHAEIPYDEVTQSFFSISFPKQKDKVIISKQISQRSLGRLIEGVASHQINLSNISNLEFRPKNDDVISSYSCQGDVATLRIKNKWKYMFFFRDNKSRLYDLEIDPNEIHDISEKFPDSILEYKSEVEDRMRERKFSDSECIK